MFFNVIIYFSSGKKGRRQYHRLLFTYKVLSNVLNIAEKSF